LTSVSERLRLELVREIPEDHNLQRDWNSLVQRMERPEVFYTYEWALAVQRAYSNSLSPLVGLAYEGGSLVGVAALATDRDHHGTSFLSGTTADYCDFLSRPEDRSLFVDTVLAELRRLKVDKVVLANLPADSSSAAALGQSSRPNGYHVLARPAYSCAQVSLGDSTVREDLKRKLLSKKMLRRYLHALEKKGRVATTHLRTWEEVREALPKFSTAHVARFLATGRISNLARSERRAFLEELAQLLSATGWLALTQLMVADRPVAWNYGFQFAGSWFWYQPTFDCELEQYSPGFCLLSRIVDEACDDPELKVLDLGLGAEGYKKRFATTVRQTLHVTLSASPSTHIRELARYQIAGKVKTSPGLERCVRTALRQGSQLAQRIRKSRVPGLWAWTAKRVWQYCFGSEEVLFYEWPATFASNESEPSGSTVLKSVDLQLLAAGAISYPDDPETLNYLLRSARRLRSKNHSGFALVTAEGVPAHFCWVSSFDGFQMAELAHTLDQPSPDAVLLFDCWTPKSARGQGHYSKTVELVAIQLRTKGKKPWIFSAASNTSSVQGLEKTGFRHRYTLARRKFLVWQRISSQPIIEAAPPAWEVPVSSS
jgi:CelD/BcsL family acetyltransferase involved in cellulose biosynthesis